MGDVKQSGRTANLEWTGVKRILIANRSECACGVIRTAKRLGLTTIAIFAPDDKQCLHVKEATISRSVSSYLAEEDILQVAKDTQADSIHPGYGFLSENAGFARKCTDRGLIWLGPSPDIMENFSSKTRAREVAEYIGVPCTPGSPVLNNKEDAVLWASKIGYPVLLKASGGGGGIGIQMCQNSEEVQESFVRVKNLSQKCFSDGSVFMEKYIRKARHIEVQVFGDGKGNVIHLGERECSTQRRYQKIIEETPSPGLNPELKEKMFEFATKLCSHVKYESAGTVEFVFDDDTKEFFFIEANTRIQVEHGITEMISKQKLDLVEWMIRQGHPSTAIDLNQFRWEPIGCAVELRIYAEEPAKHFRPSPGTVTEFQLPNLMESTRFHIGIFRGFNVSANYDPLILKVLQWAPTRSEAIRRLKGVSRNISIKGPRCNLDYLIQVIDSSGFIQGQTFTKSLSSFQYQPNCFEVVKPGMSTTVQDYPGRIKRGLWRIGVSPSGPMDHLSSRIANRLVGNAEDAATLEVTIEGPTLKFYKDTCIAVAGPPFAVTLNGIRVPQFACVQINASDIIAVGGPSSKQGVRCYIAVQGGIDVAEYLGSRSTFEKGKFGGQQGRKLLSGDMIDFGHKTDTSHPQVLEKSLWPTYTNEWKVGVLPGPHANPDFMTNEDIQMLHDSKWKVHHNSNRLGIRLIGPAPTWARKDGGEGGSHPSNIHDCVYSMGTINFTGDMPIIIAHDGPSLGGFVCPITIVSSEIWKIGQMKAGDSVQFECLKVEDAISKRLKQNSFIQSLSSSSDIVSDQAMIAVKGFTTKAILVNKSADGEQHPGMQIRLAGDSYILVEYGDMKLDILLRIRIHLLEQILLKENPIGLIETAPGVRSVQIFFDPLVLPLPALLDLVIFGDSQIADISTHSIETRVFHLPLVFNSTGVQEALRIYTQSVRPEAPYLPSNIDFIARNNGLTVEEVFERVHRASYMCLGLGDVYLGACCAVPTDPRDRLVNPKFNPARTYTQEGTVGLGGAYMCIYPMDSPGGYQLVGRTLPIWNTWALNREVFSPEKPWLLEMFDQIRFYHVEEAELDKLRQQFQWGSFVPKIEKELFAIEDYLKFLKQNEESIVQYQQKQQQAAFEESKANPYSMSSKKAVEETTKEEASNATSNQNGVCEIRAVMTAAVWSVKVKAGDTVKKGDTLVVLEAMKMEISLEAQIDGKIVKLLASQGDMVEIGSTVATMEPLGAEEHDTEQPHDDERPRFSLKISELLRQYKSGKVKPSQVVTQIFDDIERFGSKRGNIWIHLGQKIEVLTAAKVLEGRDILELPLYGIPFAVKDNYDVLGWPTTAGCPDYSYYPNSTAHCIQKLQNAGAILIGKTNMDQFATGLVGTRSPYGACENAFNPEFISGGSSSGSAVALSLGFCSFSLGTDTAGSGRVPAAFNNIVGLKPTCGRISTKGMVPACKSLDCCSIFALTSEDAASVLKVMEGEDEEDEYSRSVTTEASLPDKFKFGVPRADQLKFFGNEDGAAQLEKACRQLEMCGGTRMEINFSPFRDTADLLYGGPWVAERLAAIEEFAKSNPSSLDEVIGDIILGASKYSAVDTFRAMYKLKMLNKTAKKAWEKVDIIITPTAGRCYTIAEVNADPIQLNTNLGFYTNFMNLLELSAVALPVGIGQNGIPFGITICAPAFSDAMLLDIGQRFQAVTNLPLGKVGEKL